MGNEDFEKLYDNLSLELSKYLLKIKTCLSLSDSIEESIKQRCRKWVTKLSDPKDLNVSTLNNHITHAKILLDMLLKNKCDQPFLSDPPSGVLLPPTDNHIFSTDVDATFRNEIDKYFVISQLETSNQNSNSFQDSGINLDQLNSIFSAKQQELEKLLMKSESPTKLKKDKVEKLESKVLMMKERFREKLVVMENIHESQIKQIVARKNYELEEQAEKYEKRLLEIESEKESNETKRKLEMKTSMDTKERELFELKESHAAELKNREEMLKEQLLKKHKEECYQLERKYSDEKAELMEEMKIKVKTLNECHDNQTQKSVSQSQDLEKKIQELEADKEEIERTKKECEDLNDSLAKELEKFKNEAELFKTNFLAKESELKHLQTDCKLEVKTLKYRSEAVVDSLKQKHFATTAKLSERVNHLQKMLEAKEDQLKMLEKEKDTSAKLSKKVDDLSRSLQLKDEEMMDLLDAKSTQLKVVTEKHAQDLKEKENNHLREMEKVNKIIKEKVDRCKNMEQSLKDEMRRKDESLAATKRNLELAAERMKKFERESAKEKEDLANKATSFEKELTDLRISQQKAERTNTHKFKKLQEEIQEKMSAEAQRFGSEKKELLETITKMKEIFRKEKQSLLERHKKSISEVELKHQQRIERDLKTQEMLEGRLKKLEQDKEDSLGFLRKELSETESNKSKEMKLLKQQHQSEVDLLQKKSNSELEQMKELRENEKKKLLESHSLKMKKLRLSFESQLFESEKNLKQMTNNLKSSELKYAEQARDYNEKLAIITRNFKEERDFLNGQFQECQFKIVEVEKQLAEKEIESKESKIQFNEQISLLRCEHLEKLKTMVPSSVKDDLEKAIEALRSQVTLLKERLEMMDKQ